MTITATTRKAATDPVTARVRCRDTSMPCQYDSRKVSSGSGAASQRTCVPSRASSGSRPMTPRNHKSARGVTAMIVRMPENPAPQPHANLRSRRRPSGSSHRAMTTSLKAIPADRSRKISPPKGPHTARHSSGIGIRVIPAAAIGCSAKISIGVMASGT